MLLLTLFQYFPVKLKTQLHLFSSLVFYIHFKYTIFFVTYIEQNILYISNNAVNYASDIGLTYLNYKLLFKLQYSNICEYFNIISD